MPTRIATPPLRNKETRNVFLLKIRARPSNLGGPTERPRKISAHVYPRCKFAVDLKDLGLRGGTTGLVTCPKCEWSGPVNIGTVPREDAK